MIVPQLHSMDWRGIVYDTGLNYAPGICSVDTFDLSLVEYDMNIISNILNANVVRIEGEDIERLALASRIAHRANLRVFFNPWKMNASCDDVENYMSNAAIAAEELRKEGVDITFVSGCEYSLFDEGIFEGNSVSERLDSFMDIMSSATSQEEMYSKLNIVGDSLNNVLKRIVSAVRRHFNGDVIYSAGTWEYVDWNMFDGVGIDYYRDTQTDEEYLQGLEKYYKYQKPVWVMEVGCCTYKGAAALGGSGFTVCLGVDNEGNGIYSTGEPPLRSEKEQADYDETQITLLSRSDIEGMFIFEFSFPISPYRKIGYDADLTAYPIVKSFDKADPKSKKMPPWEPKEAFYSVGAAYLKLKNGQR